MSEEGYEDDPVVDEVRPYALTSGRTRSVVDLPLEARLTLEPSARHHSWPPEQLVTRIVEVCAQGASVAEVAAVVGSPLGVVRVLLGDLVRDGHVRVEATLRDGSSIGERHELIERTLSGLRAII